MTLDEAEQALQVNPDEIDDLNERMAARAKVTQGAATVLISVARSLDRIATVLDDFTDGRGTANVKVRG